MRRIQLSFPTILFGMSFVLCMVVALLFINRQSTDDYEAGARSSSRSARAEDADATSARSLASMPSEALPPAPISYAESEARSVAEAAPQAFPSPTTSILSEAVTAREQRLISQNAGPEAAAVAGVTYAAESASPAPGLPGYAPTPNPLAGMSPKQIAALATGKDPRYIASAKFPPQQSQPAAAVPPIAVPPGMEYQFAPTPTPTPAYQLMPNTRTWLPSQTNYGPNANSLESIARGGATPTPYYGRFPFPSNADQRGFGVLPPPPQPVASAPSGAGLPAEQTMFSGRARLTPAILNGGSYGSTPAAPDSDWNPNSLEAALSPAPSLSAEAAMEELPVTLMPVDESPALTPSPGPAASAPAPMPVSTPARTPTPEEFARMAATQVTPAQPETVSVEKNGAQVTAYNVTPGWTKPGASATAASKPDVQEAIRKLQDASARVSPQPGQAPGSVPPVPTVSPALISSGGTLGQIRYLEQARDAARGNAPAPAFDKPLPPEVMAKIGRDPLQPDVAAKVGDKVLTSKDANRRVEAMLKLQGKTADADRKVVLSRLVAEEWAEKTALAEEAKRQGITASEEDVRDFLERSRERFGDKLQSSLRSAGFSDEEIREEMRNSALCEKLIESTLDRKYDDARLRKIYESNPEEFRPSRRLRVQEIVKEKPKDEAGVREAKQRVQELHRQATSGGSDFGRLASEQSDAPTRTKGGEIWLGDHNAARISPEMAKALENLKPGQVSGVVEDEDSFAIYKLVEVEDPKPGFEGAKERVLAKLKEREKEEVYEEAQKRAPVVLAHKDRKPSGARVTRPGENSSAAASRARAAASSGSGSSSRGDSHSGGRSEPRPDRGSGGRGGADDLAAATAALAASSASPLDLQQAMSAPAAPGRSAEAEENRGSGISRHWKGISSRGQRETNQERADAMSASSRANAQMSGAVGGQGGSAGQVTRQTRPERSAGSAPQAPAGGSGDLPAGFGGPTDAGTAPAEDSSGGGIRGIFNRFRRD